MNFAKLMIIVAAAVVLIAGYNYFTRVDRSDPVAVGNAFTKELKRNNTTAASKFVVPADAKAWRASADDHIRSLGSNRREMFFERIPAQPGYGDPVTVDGRTRLVCAESSYTLELTQINGKWYVSSAPL